MTEVERALAELADRKRALDGHRPLPALTADSLQAALRVEFTYASNAIEGNRLTLSETSVVLEGFTVGGKPLRDHLEAIDHADAYDYVRDLTKRQEPISEQTIRSVHSLVLRRAWPDEAGRYRQVNVYITGSKHTPPEHVTVPEHMEGLVRWLRGAEGDGRSPVALAAEFHARLVNIHPFADGNGRTTRLVSNLLLMRQGYPPALWGPDDRPRYYDALETAALHGRYDGIVLLTAEVVGRLMSRYDEAFRMAEELPPPDHKRRHNRAIER